MFFSQLSEKRESNKSWNSITNFLQSKRKAFLFDFHDQQVSV